jgi:hypothetical protein
MYSFIALYSEPRVVSGGESTTDTSEIPLTVSLSVASLIS